VGACVLDVKRERWECVGYEEGGWYVFDVKREGGGGVFEVKREGGGCVLDVKRGNVRTS